jgi:hypothetical protein
VSDDQPVRQTLFGIFYSFYVPPSLLTKNRPFIKYTPQYRNEWEQRGSLAMRRILCVICVAFAISSVGCFSFMDDIRRDTGHISKMGGSAKARSIENDVDWGTSF